MLGPMVESLVKLGYSQLMFNGLSAPPVIGCADPDLNRVHVYTAVRNGACVDQDRHRYSNFSDVRWRAERGEVILFDARSRLELQHRDVVVDPYFDKQDDVAPYAENRLPAKLVFWRYTRQDEDVLVPAHTVLVKGWNVTVPAQTITLKAVPKFEQFAVWTRPDLRNKEVDS